MVLPELHRVSVLYLASRLEPLQSLVDGFVHAAPKLESLCLHRSYSPQYPNKRVHIPDAIFSRQTPALRTLILQNCIFTSPSPSSTPLPSSDSQIVRIPSTISQIVSSLCRTPMLHTLVLYNVLPEHRFTDTGAYPKLFLPKLSRLAVTSTVSSCTILLEHLIIPNTTTIALQCNQNPLWNDRLFRALPSAIGKEKAKLIISALGLKIMSNIRVGFIDMLYTVFHSYQSAPTKFAFEFVTRDYSREIYQDIFNTASITLPPADVRGLEISGNGPHWPINFESLPNLRAIRFETSDFPLEIVSAALGDEGHSHKLPHLCSLLFFNVAFSDEGTATLINGLKCRQLSGFPIKNIHLRTCDISEVDVTRMKEFVQDVNWDGHTSSAPQRESGHS
jgi:hypothetical protein